MFRLTLIYLIFFSYYSVIEIDCDNIIFPGTKWCGKGNIAKNVSDLGFAKLTDQCCRDHDLCPYFIRANQTKYGLINNDLITKSLCSCDKKLHNCLKNINSIFSNIIGNVYFNILQIKCFDYECESKHREYWDDCNKFKKSGTKTWYKNKKF